VVEKQVKSRRREMVRLQELISPLDLAADVLVVSEKLFDDWRDTPGNLIYYAAQEGRVMYEMDRTGKSPA
jgi:hypothetical protein